MLQSIDILLNRQGFRTIIKFFLFECPVQYNYGKAVSARGISFEKRKLSNKALNSLIAAMRRSSDISIHTVKDNPIAPDGKNEYLIVKEHSEMSVVNAYYYSIRNAFAHGSFSYENGIYLFENYRKGKLRAIGRIKEKTLLEWIKLCNMKVSEIKIYRK